MEAYKGTNAVVSCDIDNRICFIKMNNPGKALRPENHEFLTPQN